VTGPSILTAADVDALVAGVELLGSGGGGDASTFGLLLRHGLADRPLRLHDADSLSGRVVVPVGIVGATSVFREKLPDGSELAGAVRAVCRSAGLEPTAVMSVEAGGLNGLSGLVASLDLEVPFLDADLMGRALPRLDQFSWAVEGLPLTPCALAEPGGQAVVIDQAPPAVLERAVRAFVYETGGWAALALRPTPVETAAGAAITGSVSRALDLGRAHAGLGEHPDPVAVAVSLDGTVLADGRVIEVSRYGRTGVFGRGSVAVIDARSGGVVRIETENEFLLALVDGTPTVGTPDLICVLDRRTARPIAADRVRAGDEVLVLALPGPHWWSGTAERLAVVGPAAFGIDAPLLPIGKHR
jgi:DUF917 family protein